MDDAMLQDCPTSLTAHRIGSRLALLVWDGTAATNARRLRVVVDGARCKPPFTQIAVALDRRRCRNVLAVGVGEQPWRALEVAEETGSVIARSPKAADPFQSRLEFDAAEILAGVNGVGRARVARFMLEVCVPLFRAAADPVLIANAKTLLEEVVAGTGLLTPRCTLGSQHLFCEASVPRELEERLSAVLITADGVHRIVLGPKVLGEVQRRPGLAAVGFVLERPLLGHGGLIVVFGERGLVCRKLAPVVQKLPSVQEWFAKHGDKKPQHRHYLLECLARTDFGADQGALLLRELNLLASTGPAKRNIEAPGGALHAGIDIIVGCDAGVFVSGRLTDPHRLVEAVIVERDGVDRAVDIASSVRFRPAAGKAEGAALPMPYGFAFFAKSDGLPDGQADGRAALAPVRIALGLRSGARIDLAEGPAVLTPEESLTALLRGFPAEETENAALLDHLEPAVSALVRDRLRFRRHLAIIDLGAPPRAAQVSLILPAASDAQRLRCQMGLFAVDPAMAGVEILYLVEDTEQGDATVRLLGDLQAAYGLALRAVRMDQGLPPGAMLNAGAGIACGEYLAFLGLDVVPEAPGWIAKLIDFIAERPQRAIVGGQPLNEDHSLVSVGVDLVCDDRVHWTLRPALSGFPRDYPPAAVPSRVVAVSHECLLVRRALLEATGGFDKDRLLPAAAAAGLCLSAGAKDLEAWRLPDPAVFRLGDPACGGGPLAVRLALDGRALARRWLLPTASATAVNDVRRAPQLRLAASGGSWPSTQRAA